MRQAVKEIRDICESDLVSFARLVNPRRLYGEIHERVFRWLEDETDDNQLVLLPRGHMKSHMMAVWCAWWVTKHPDTSIMYISATSGLAEDQLYAIKGMMDSRVYKRYWPEMLDVEEGKRERWSATAISVDHPNRKDELIRDPTIRTAGLTTNTTGYHADIIVSDDVVVPENAYTEEGRRKTAAAMSQMSSIKNAGGMIKACGTRYHPNDQYQIWKEQQEALYNEDDEIISYKAIWDILEEVVELDGAFLWTREARADGVRFGFNRRVLARIYAEYTDKAQYYAQYYNNPNDPDSNRVDKTRFQYYDQRHLQQRIGTWFFKEKKLNVSASVDFAFSLSSKSDYTAIVVIGIDSIGDIYVLDMIRFKTDKISRLYEEIIAMQSKWQFRKIRAEVTAAQGMIVNDIKQRFKDNGVLIKVDEHRPTRHTGSKEERIAAVLEPRYQQLGIWHYRGGYTPVLEEEILLTRPQHDDLVDALAAGVEIAVKPRASHKSTNKVVPFQSSYNRRFGGYGTTMRK